MTALTLGFMPLTDCAPLVVAREKGFFAEEGLKVALSREASWATIRDKVAVGALDGAHMLGPMALASTLGVGGEPAAMIAPIALNRNGGGITVSRALAAEIAAAGSFASAVRIRRTAGAAVLTFAVVFPYSMHNYALRGWLSAAGVDPDQDVRVLVVPPPRMVEQLADGRIDGFCAGAPWNAVAAAGAGETLTTTAVLHPGGPDKVLGIGEAWANSDPERLSALLRALSRAGQWADDPANRAELVALLARPDAVGVDPAAVAPALGGEIVFQTGGAAVPRQADALWFLSQMQRWGQIDPGLDQAALAARVYRSDLLEQALAGAG